jgi:hypothetical protein
MDQDINIVGEGNWKFVAMNRKSWQKYLLKVKVHCVQ